MPLLKLIEQIYDAALDPGAWPVFLNELVGTLNAKSALIRVHDLEDEAVGYVSSVGYEEKYLLQYREHFIHLDPFLPVLKRLRPGTIALGRDAISDRDFVKTEFYNDYGRPQGSFHTIGGIVFRQGSRMAMFAVQRGMEVGVYDERELALVNALAPHLDRCFRIQSQLIDLKANVNSVEMVLDQLAVGVVLLDESGHALFVNRRAEEILNTHPGLNLSASSLHTPQPILTDALRAIVVEAVRTGRGLGIHPGGTLVLDGDDNAGPLHLLIAPMPMGSGELLLGGKRACAAVFIGSPHDQQTMATDVISALFGLTKAEARLAAALAAGQALAEIAAGWSISIHTARTQLKRIFLKTDTHSQAELVATVLASPAAAVMRQHGEKKSE